MQLFSLIGHLHASRMRPDQLWKLALGRREDLRKSVLEVELEGEEGSEFADGVGEERRVVRMAVNRRWKV